MPTADGSIVVKIDADDKAAERKLKSLQNQIDRLEDKIYKTQAKRSPLVAQAKELGAALDAAKQKLYEMQNAEKGRFSKLQVAAQGENVKRACKRSITPCSHRWSGTTGSSKRLILIWIMPKRRPEHCISSLQRRDRLRKRWRRLWKRHRKAQNGLRAVCGRVLRSALVFTVISQALSKFRDWMGKSHTDKCRGAGGVCTAERSALDVGAAACRGDYPGADGVYQRAYPNCYRNRTACVHAFWEND